MIGHVERTWSCSFHGGGVGSQLQTFQSVMQCLLGSHRVGWALEYFGALYAALATELTGEITLETQGQRPDDALLAELWTAHNDARGFVVLGDPAVRLGCSAAGIAPTPVREPLAEVTTSAQANLRAESETAPMPRPDPTPNPLSPPPEASSDDETAASLPLDATERRFQAWDSVKGAGKGEKLGTAPGSSSFSFSLEGIGADTRATPTIVDEQKLLRERNDPERLRRLLRRRGMTDLEIKRATGEGPVSFTTLPADRESVFDEQIGLERILGKRDLVDSWFLEAGARAARAVGRVRICTASGRTKGYGTASLIGPGLLLTNHHVLPDEATAAASVVEFGVEEDADSRERAPEAFVLRPDLLFLTDTAEGDGLDFTLVAVAPRGEAGGDLSGFGWNRPMEDDDPILVRQYVNIIQHPQGQSKQVALRDSQVIDLLENFLHYRADTEPGSSGAPVFNDYWELVGLHHSGVPRRDPSTKEILTRWGAVWDRKNERDVDWIANEGVRLSRILTRLKAEALKGEASRLRDLLLSAEPGLSSRPERRPLIPEPDEAELASAEGGRPGAPVMAKLPPTPTPMVSIGTVDVATGVAQGTVSVTIPFQVQVEVRILPPGSAASTSSMTAAAPTTQPVVPAPVLSPPPEFVEAVSIDPDYGNRRGYNPAFLGAGSLRVELPTMSAELAEAAARVVSAASGELPYELKYHHYSAVVHRERHLAIFTAVNIEGDRKDHQTREADKWIRDPRIDPHIQVGNDFYKGTPFDRGHLVRRIDPAWGTDARVAKVANDDTFHFTNCAPQHKNYNRGLELWRGLEDFLIERAVEDSRRITVFTGPLFDRDQKLKVSPDPEYAGVKVPRWYWKVAALVRPEGTLGVLGFLVSQADLASQAVANLRAEEAAVDVASTFQVPVTRIARLTGLDFGPLASREAPTVAGFGREASVEDEAMVQINSKEEIRIPWMIAGS